MATNTNPFLDFSQQPVGTPGTTTQQAGSGLLNFLGPLSQNASTVPFVNGGNVSPGNITSGITAPNGQKTIGTQAQSPSQSQSVSLGTTAKSPQSNMANPSNVLSPQYANTSSSAPVNSAPVSTVTKAPPGMEYGPTGQLQPISNNPAPTQQPNYSQSNPVTLPQLLNQTANAASQPNPNYTAAMSEYNSAANALQESQTNQANAMALNASNPIPLEFQQGRGQILQTQYGQQQAALGSRLQAASTALGAANTQGQIQQQGLLGAAALSVPQLGAYGQTYYNPLTQSASNSSGNFGTGPAAAANVQSIQQQTQQVNDWNAARQSASNLENQLTSFVSQNGINPSDFNAVNRFLQSIGAQTSSPQYQTFKNVVNDLASVYAQILTPAGGSQTDKVREIAQSLVDATASGKSISAILQGLQQQAQSKISGVQTNIQNLQNGGGSQSNPSGGIFGSFFQ